MTRQRLAPRMQDPEKAHLVCPQPLRVAAKRLQRLRRAAKEQIIHHTLIVQTEGIDRVGQRKHHMEVRHRQQLLHPGFHPLHPILALTGRTMAIAAGIGAHLGMPTMGTDIEVIASLKGTALANGIHHLTLLGGDRMGGEIGLAIPPAHVG